MIITILSDLGPGTPDVEKIVGYNQVMAYFLQREFQWLGHECHLHPQKMLGVEPPPQSDACLALSARSIKRLLNEPGLMEQVRPTTKRLIRMSDGARRSVYDWGKRTTDGAYYGLGVDDGWCFPDRDDGEDVIIFNPWKHPASTKGAGMMAIHEEAVESLKLMQSQGARIWSIGIRMGWEDGVIGRDRNPPLPDGHLSYEPWAVVCRAMRKGLVFFDTTPKVVELGRIEAAVCGNVLLVPRDKLSLDTPVEGTKYLNQLEFVPGQMYDRLVDAMEEAHSHDPVADSKRALEYFNWPLVAKRIINFLKG